MCFVNVWLPSGIWWRSQFEKLIHAGWQFAVRLWLFAFRGQELDISGLVFAFYVSQSALPSG